MERTRVLGAACLLAVLAAGEGEAQQGGVAVRAGRVADERGVAHGGLSASSSLRWSGEGSTLALGVQGTVLDGGTVVGAAEASGGVTLAGAGPAALVLAAAGSTTESTAGYRGLAGRIGPRLVVGGAGWGIAGGPFLGGGGARVASVGDPWPLLSGGTSGGMEWWGARGVSAQGWLEGAAGALRAGWAETHARGAAWRDVTAGVVVRSGRVALGGEVGARLGEEGERWAAANAVLRVRGGTSLVGEVGRYPSDPLTGRAAGRFASVGVSVEMGGRGDAP